MASLTCLGCGHEFPAEGARRKPDPVGRVIAAVLAGASVLAAAACFWVGQPVYGVMSGACAVMLAGLAVTLGKGFYAFCPACGKGMGVSSESASARAMKKKKG